DASFRYQQALTGVNEQQPRWKRCIQAANSLLGDALGQAYVKQTFTPDARRRARDMVDHLVAALDDRLHTLEWMGDSTRAQAVAKLRAFGKKIGYPDKWRDYSRLVVDARDFAGNVVRAQTFAQAWDLARIDKPVDKAEWRMTAPTVNASYSPTFNDITFPAGILQAPFFDPAADDAVTYGGMAAGTARPPSTASPRSSASSSRGPRSGAPRPPTSTCATRWSWTPTPRRIGAAWARSRT